MNKPRIACALLALAAPVSAQQEPATAVTHVSVVSMVRGELLEDQTVRIVGDRIVALGPADEVNLTGVQQVIDGAGRFLMPGLCDMHVHISDPRDGLLYVANGVTTIRNLSGQPYHLDLAAAFERGDWLGPHLVSSSQQVRLAEDASEADATEVVSLARRQGFASVKLYGRTSLENLAALIEAGAEFDIPIVGHIPRDRTLEEVMEVGGLREISHAEELLYAFFDRRAAPSEEVLDECVALLAGSDTYVTPTLSVYREIAPQVSDLEGVMARPQMRFLAPLAHAVFGPLNKYGSFDQGDIRRLERGSRTIARLTAALQAADVPLLLGTDAMNPAVMPGFSIHDELAELVASGLTPLEALRAGTIVPAGFWGRATDFGRVAVGQRADLVLLESNPLEDVGHFRDLVGVVLRGRWLPAQELQRQLEAQAAGFAREAAAMVELDRSDPTAMLAAAARGDEQPPEAFFLSVASVYTLTDNATGAEAVIDYALARTPTSILLLNRKGELRQAAGDFAAAGELYERTLELAPGNSVARRALDALP